MILTLTRSEQTNVFNLRLDDTIRCRGH